MGRKKSALKIDDDEYSLPQDDESKDDHQTQIRNQNNMFIELHDANGDAVSRIEEEKPSSMMVDDGDPIDMVFSGKKKKKSSKSKKVSTFSALDDVDEDREGNGKDTVIELEEEEKKVEFVEEVVPTKKQNKKNKKKNKSGRTNQEEEDLDRILAELNGAPTTVTSSVPVSVASSSKPVVEVPVVEVVDMGKVEESEGIVDQGKVEEVEVAVESAAEKKKRKKKEKEKEKKAAAAAVKELNEAKGKMTDNKKVPKAVREMQEKIARRKEIEDKRRMEEEERLRKEEEERLRLEEIERQAEEIKRKKKEREKEKLRKKKEDGLLLTGKAKQEAKRLESMRNQFLQNSEANLLTSGTEAKKKPVYKKKKHGSAKQADDLVGNQQISHHDGTQEEAVLQMSEEIDLVDEGESSISPEGETEEKQEVVEPEVIEEDEEEDDWDAKSWDNVDVTLPVTNIFEDEEEELVAAKPVAKKVIDQVAKAEQHGNEKIPAKSTVKKGSSPHLSESKEKDDKVAASFDTNHQKENAKKNSDNTSKKGGNGNLRSPICCILGHVDTGKTKLLDCIRGTNVQEGEAGGITQQIGATYFPTDNIRERTKELKADAMLKVPGLLVIDTPGHEAFTNLRSRGSSLCDIAILVVDIMHGLEPQTIESLNLLKSRNAEFIVALNKVDRLYGWKKCPNAPIVKAMKLQSVDVQNEFKMRVTQIITQFKEQGLNTELYYKNKNMGETSSIVPTSAMSGEGIPDLLLLLVNWAQRTMEEKLTFMDDIQCTVLEVKVIEGLGTTIDVVLVNGVLHEGDQIVVCGMQGPITTNIRALLTPHPMKELRVKGSYLHHKEVKAAQGVKITAQGLEHAVAGTALYVVGPDDDLDDVKDLAMQDMKNVMSRIDKSGEGVCVQASTIGSLEALLEFLKTPAVNIPVSGINIGPVHKKDVMKASVMLERKKEYATILAFDVKATPEARELAEDSGVQIFIADIIYHLFDQFKAYMESIKAEKKKETAEEAVFPCHLKIMPNCIFNKKDPIVLGVDVVEGIAKVGTPICIPSREFIDIGRITSIEINHKQVDTAKKGLKVAIKILGSNAEEQQKMFGRHFEMEDDLYSHISRKSIDILKANYRDELSTEEWQLVVRLKKLFSIP